MNDTTKTPEAKTDEAKRSMHFVVLENGTIEAQFPGLDPLRLDPADVPELTQMAAITEGLISRSRAYTGGISGDERTPKLMRECIEKAFANLRAGVWKVERAGAAASYTIEEEAALLFRQLRAAAKGEECTDTQAQVAEEWNKLTEEQIKTVKATPRFQQALAQVKAARAAAKAAKASKKAEAEDAEDSPF